MKREPSLKDLGLDEPIAPPKVGGGTISIERLQRESEIEAAMPHKEIAIEQAKSRNVALDIAAFVLSAIPGAGHLLKGRLLLAIVWFAATLLLYAISFPVLPLFFLPGALAHIACIASAIMCDPAY